MSDERFGIGGDAEGGVWTATPIYLDSLVDTVVDDPTDGFVLTYEASSGKWKAKSVSGVSDTKVYVYEEGVQVGTVARYVNFAGADFNVTEDGPNDWFLIEFAGTGMEAHDMTGGYHTEDATGGAGNVIRATGATAFAWAQLGHGDLGSVTSDQHHAQQHTLSGSDHTGDLAYSQVDDIVDIVGIGANNLLSRADHVHTDADGSSKVTYSNLSGIPSTFTPDAHDLTSAFHTDSGLTTGHFLKATGLTTFAWQAHGLGASDVGAYTTAQTDSAIDTDITTHAGIATAHQDAPGLISTHTAIATAHQDAPGLITTHAAISGAHHSQGHVLSGGDHTATGLTVGWVIAADSSTTFSWQAPSGGTDPNAIHDNVANEIQVITGKGAPVGADVIIIEDSADSWNKKSVTITNLPGGADADAIHDNVSNEIQVITAKASPVGADVILIEDSAATWQKKSVLISNLPAGSPSFGLPVSIDIGDAQAEGTSGDSARSDHQHAFAAPGAGYPLDVAATESDGVATTAARSDHVHAHGTGYSANAHHNQAHILSGTDHTASGLTIGHAIIADSATTFSWQSPSYYNSFTTDFAAESLANLTTRAHSDLSDAPTDAHHSESHVLSGGTHTATGLTVGWVISADSATTFSWKAPTGGTDPDAIHDNVADEIHQVTLKGTPISADEILIEDSAALWAKKRIAISTLPAGSPSFGAPTGNIDIGDAAVEGTSGDSSRADHQHAFTAPGVGYPLDVAETESDGSATTPARSDHVHAHGTGYLPDAHHAQAHVLATTGPHSGTLPVADIANGTQYQYLRAGASTPEFQARKFTISTTIKSPAAGYTTVWRAPFGCTCTKLEGRQKGGTSTVINARYNGTTDVATADLTLTAANQWYDTTGIAQTAWSATDWLEFEVQTLGGATEITFVLTFTEP